MNRYGAGMPSGFRSWSGMMDRCGRHRGYLNVSVCDKWKTYEGFYEDMGDRPAGHTLDRIDPAGNYEPGNCRWATTSVQSRNQRKRRGTTTASKGVKLRKRDGYSDGYRAGIKMPGARVAINLGSFDTEEAAALAYQTAIDRFERLGFVSYPWFTKPRGRISL